jgi:hypothetical protein
MKKLLGLIGLMGLMGLLPVKPILPINPVCAQDTNRLFLHVDGSTFFIDNEYFGDRISGYTLPGFVLQPKVEWKLNKSLTIMGGLHWLNYWGARDYPATTAYGPYPLYDSVSHAVHILPWLQASVRFNSYVTLTIGCLNNDGHELPLPLYNFERKLVGDPEAGFSLYLNADWLTMEVWTDWREYIWDRSPVPERFTAGASGRLMLNNEDLTLYLPLHFVAQHEGGQNMSVSHNINNNFNGATGLGVGKVWRDFWLDASCRVMWYHQHGNAAIPFENGWGIFPQIGLNHLTDWRICVNYWHGENFVPLLGSWHFSNLSANTDGLTFDRTRVLSLYADWKWQFGNGDFFLYGTLYHYLPSTGTFADGSTKDYGHRNQFSVGAAILFYPTVKLH